MNIIKKSTGAGSTEYYYLQHSVRIGSQVKKYDVYIGKTIPENIDSIKNGLFQKIRQDKYGPKLETIQKTYRQSLSTLSPTALRKQLTNFGISFTFNTQKIEGSTLSLRETSLLIDRGISPPNKPIADSIEALEHVKLLQRLIQSIPSITFNSVLSWHYDLFSQTKHDIAGKIRPHGVLISGSTYVPPTPLEVQPLLNEFFDWYEHSKDKIHSVELAALAHLKFVTIHPFTDGNGRISRLLMNVILFQNNYPMLDITYEKRNRYYKALEKSQTLENDHYFLDWFLSYYCTKNSR